MLESPSLTAMWGPNGGRTPGDSSAPCVRLQIEVLGATIYNPRLQTDIIVSLYAKMQLWFYINLSFKKIFF